MLLTYKIKHSRDFSEELRKAQKVAEFCIKDRIRNRGLNPPPGQKTLCEFFSSFSSSSPFSDLFSSSHNSNFRPEADSTISPTLSSHFSQFSRSTRPILFPLSPQSTQSSLSPITPLSACLHDHQISQLSEILTSSPKSGFVSSSEAGLSSKDLTPEDVKHIGLKSTLSGQILRKYSRNNELRSAKNVKLIVPRRAIIIDRDKQTLTIPCLKLLLSYSFPGNFKKIAQIEIDSVYAYVTVVFPDQAPDSSEQYIGVDRNTKGHIAVVADPETGKVWKLGKGRYHIYKKYENIKKRLYNKNNFRRLRVVERREKNIVKDLNHKISRKIVDIALYSGCGIKLENLKGIRKAEVKFRNRKKGKKNKNEDNAEGLESDPKKNQMEIYKIGKIREQIPDEPAAGEINKNKSENENKKENKKENENEKEIEIEIEVETEKEKGNKEENKNKNKNKSENKEIKTFFSDSLKKAEKRLWLYEYSLNSWSFNQLQRFIEYKARLRGIEVTYIDPHATSKKCSRCGHKGNRHSKHFKCPDCGHVDHADVNAAFNIALTPKGNGQFPVERDAGKGSSDTPQKILDRTFLNKNVPGKKTSSHFAWEVCQFLT
ncbi:MAG: zinc ribbon domain-containing protein [Methanosarcina sp.]